MSSFMISWLDNANPIDDVDTNAEKCLILTKAKLHVERINEVLFIIN